MKIPVHSVLFKRLTDINWRALTGQEKGQYDLRLGTNPPFGQFFEPIPSQDPTPIGGWSRIVAFEPFTGPNPLPAATITFRYMGADSARKDFYFASQKHDLDESYPLWRPGRTAPLEAPFAEIEGAVVLVVRDIEDRYHARWLTAEAVNRLPPALRSRILDEEKGVFVATDAVPAISPTGQVVLEALQAHHNVLLYGPPGTGKTFLLQEIMESFGRLTIDTDEEHDPLDGGAATRSTWVTFHQSYSYEDFLVGLRPKPATGGGFDLVPVAGTLLELSEWARQPGNRALLVIDEINRGNVSRIFGELITLLEVDKRLDAMGAEQPTTVSVRLPYLAAGDHLEVALPDGVVVVPNPFTMPRDVFILATMNSVDTSVAPLDAALRRRFTMVPLVPDPLAMADKLGLGELSVLPPLDLELPSREAIVTLALRLLNRLNYGVAQFLGDDFCFGHWYLQPLVSATNRTAAVAALAGVWQSSLLPQLIEHFNGRTEQLLAALGNPSGQPALVVTQPALDWEALGATASISAVPAATDDEILQLLLHIAKQSTT